MCVCVYQSMPYQSAYIIYIKVYHNLKSSPNSIKYKSINAKCTYQSIFTKVNLTQGYHLRLVILSVTSVVSPARLPGALLTRCKLGHEHSLKTDNPCRSATDCYLTVSNSCHMASDSCIIASTYYSSWTV